MISREDRFAQIAKLGEIIFHTRDLANLWQIENPNTLYTALKRYAQKGLLFRIYKGFYAIKPIDQLDPLALGIKALRQFAYVSVETVLFQEGIVQQSVGNITLISSQSKKFSIGNYHYHSRKLEDKYLYQTTGVIDKNGVKTATVSRAVADLLHFNPQAHFDADKLIDWKEIKKYSKRWAILQLRGVIIINIVYDDFAQSERSNSQSVALSFAFRDIRQSSVGKFSLF